MARPSIVWADKEWEQFEELCNIQCTEAEICRVMGVTDKTLTRLVADRYKESFSETYKKLSEGGRACLRRYQFQMAKTNPTMAIWLGKQYLGQKDQQEVKNDTTIGIADSDRALLEKVQKRLYGD